MSLEAGVTEDCRKLLVLGASHVALVVKNPPPTAGDVRDAGSIPRLGRSPGGGMATHSSILAWEIAEPSRA